MKLFYIGWYVIYDSKIDRECFPAEVNKMTYIARVLQNNGFDIEIVSESLPEGRRFFYPLESVVEDGIKVHFLPFFSLFSHPKLKDRWRSMMLFLYGLFHFTSKDVIVSYHTNSIASKSLVYLRRIKKFKVILEVEEIYADLLTKFASVQLKREQLAFDNCDGYIFSTELLELRINKKNLPSVVIYGTYQKDTQPCIKVDNLVHVLYGGTLDPRKGGATAAAAAAAFLPKNYCMHICGFGSKDEVDLIKSKIDELRNKGCNVCFEGLLKGQRYLDMLHRCQIGLSTQDPNAKFNNTSFPSKILSYMAAGLSVVSIRIPAIEKSKIGKSIAFYDIQSPEEIANSIIKCDVSQGEKNKKVIASLDEDFQVDIRRCIQEVRKARYN